MSVPEVTQNVRTPGTRAAFFLVRSGSSSIHTCSLPHECSCIYSARVRVWRTAGGRFPGRAQPAVSYLEVKERNCEFCWRSHVWSESRFSTGKPPVLPWAWPTRSQVVFMIWLILFPLFSWNQLIQYLNVFIFLIFSIFPELFKNTGSFTHYGCFHLHSSSVAGRAPGNVSWQKFAKWENQWISLWMGPRRRRPAFHDFHQLSAVSIETEASLPLTVCEFQWSLGSRRFDGTLAEPQKDLPRTSLYYRWGVRARTKEEAKEEEGEEETKLPLKKITSSVWGHEGPRLS